MKNLHLQKNIFAVLDKNYIEKYIYNLLEERF